jgi:CheY-like chemotaxis protein
MAVQNSRPVNFRVIQSGPFASIRRPPGIGTVVNGVDGFGGVLMESRQAAEHGDELEMDVLVVEAHPLLRRHIVDLLRADGYRVGEADDGFAALQQIRSKRIGAILLDPAIRVLDGFDLLEKLDGIGCPPVVMLETEQKQPGGTVSGSETMTNVRHATEPSLLPLLVRAALEAGGWPSRLHQHSPASTGARFDTVCD